MLRPPPKKKMLIKTVNVTYKTKCSGGTELWYQTQCFESVTKFPQHRVNRLGQNKQLSQAKCSSKHNKQG